VATGFFTRRETMNLNAEEPVPETTDVNDMTYPCPKCGDRANVVGGFNEIDYIECSKCGYYGDHLEAGGIVYDIEVPTVDGMRCKDEAAYRRRIAEIEQEAEARRIARAVS
jgi:hypothetical protein